MVIDLQAHPSFEKLFQVPRRKMGSFCAPTLENQEKQYLKVVEDNLKKIARKHLVRRF